MASSSQMCETLPLVGVGDDEYFKGMENLKINKALLMSLMEESQDDESDDDDRLDSLIRSLEAEINVSTMDGLDSSSTNGEDSESLNAGQMDGQDYYTASSCDFGVEYVDMDFMPCSPCDDDWRWNIDPYGDENNRIIEFLDVSSDCLSMSDGYNCIWKESLLFSADM